MKNKFNYPEEFKHKVKMLYPEHEKIHLLLEEGSVGRLGVVLQDLEPEVFTAEEILNVNTLEELEELKKKAQRVNLYSEWAEIAYSR